MEDCRNPSLPPHNLREHTEGLPPATLGMRLFGPLMMLAVAARIAEGQAGYPPTVNRSFIVVPAELPDVARLAESGRELRQQIYGQWGATGRRSSNCRLPGGHVLPSCSRHAAPSAGGQVDATLATDVGVFVINQIVTADTGSPYFAWLPTPQTTNGPAELHRLSRLAVRGDTVNCIGTDCIRPAFSVHGADTVVHLCHAVRIRNVIGPPESCRPVGTWGPRGSFAHVLVGWGKADIAARVNTAAPSASFTAADVRELELRVLHTTDAQRLFVLEELERALGTDPWALTTELRPRTPPHNRVLGLVTFRHSPLLLTKWEIVKVEVELDNPQPAPGGSLSRIVISIDARNSRQNVADAAGFVAASDADYAVYETALTKAITDRLAARCPRGSDARTLRCTS